MKKIGLSLLLCLSCCLISHSASGKTTKAPTKVTITVKYKYRDTQSNTVVTKTLKKYKVTKGNYFSLSYKNFPKKSMTERQNIKRFKAVKSKTVVSNYKMIPRTFTFNVSTRFYDTELKKQRTETFKTFKVKEGSKWKLSYNALKVRPGNTRQGIPTVTVTGNRNFTIQYLPVLQNETIPSAWQALVQEQFPIALTFTNRMMKVDESGAPWGQCTWGVKNFVRKAYGVIYPAAGNGKDVANSLIRWGWTKSNKPVAGSVVSYNWGSVLGHPYLPIINWYGYYGHVAMVIAVNEKNGSYLIAETNFNDRQTINYRVSTLCVGQTFAVFPEKPLNTKYFKPAT